MATLGVMNKNNGQDTKIYGLHDNLFRRRIDLQREEGDTPFTYPSGPGSGTRNAMVWHPDPVDLPYAGRRHFPHYTRHKRLGYQDKTNMESRDATPQPQYRVSHRYDHLKKSSVFPFDNVKQKGSPTDRRNGIGVAAPGDKPYRRPEQAAGYFTRGRDDGDMGGLRGITYSAPPLLHGGTTGGLPEGYIRWQNRHNVQDVIDVQEIADTWKPVPPLEPLTIVD